MPVRHNDFAFSSDKFDPSEYPEEIRPTVGDDRFPPTPPKPAPEGDDALSKTARQFAARVAEINGVDPEEVPEGLLRLVDAADAWPEENVKGLAAGRQRSISTEKGSIVHGEFFMNPFVGEHDPNNGRNAADARSQGLPYLEAIADDPVTGAPVLRVESAAEFLHSMQEAARALGFTNNVTDAKDRADINWVGLQGVHDPALVIPTIVQDAVGNCRWMLKFADGNRRLAMQRRIVREVTRLSPSEIEAWADHLYQPDGTPVLRDWTAADVRHARRKAQLKDPAYWRPASAAPETVEKWLATANMAQRTLLRCSVIPVRLVLGYRNLAETSAGRSRSHQAVQRYIRRLHIKSAAQKEWVAAAQTTDVSLEALEQIRLRSDIHGYEMPLDKDDLERVWANKTTDWDGADADDPAHPLRLAAKAMATFVCTGHTAEADVKAALIGHSMSTHHTKIRENRAAVAASVAMPILGITTEDKSDYNRARATVDRVARHPMFVAVQKHPGGTSDPWWRHLHRPASELEKLSLQEFDNKMGSDAGPDDSSVGTYGPATRALLFLATIGQATNPAFRETAKGEQASPWQLTLNGLGGTRGNTLTTPDLVMSQVLAQHKKDGVRQLAEIVRAALAGEVPDNTLDPGYVEYDRKGQPVAGAAGTVTERFLRSAAMGWAPRDDDGPKPTPATGDEFDRALDELSAAVTTAANSAIPLTADVKVRRRFLAAGLPAGYTEDLLPKARKVVKVLEHGEFIASMHSGPVVDDLNTTDPDDNDPDDNGNGAQ